MKLYYLAQTDRGEDGDIDHIVKYEDLIEVCYLAVYLKKDDDEYYFIDPSNPNTLYYGEEYAVHSTFTDLDYPVLWEGRKLEDKYWRMFISACFENLEEIS